MSYGAISASLDIGPAGPGLVGKLLAVDVCLFVCGFVPYR